MKRLFTTSAILTKVPKSALNSTRTKSKKVDTDERRGYKYDAELNLHAYLDRTGPMSLGAGEAEGFKARGLRLSADPASPEEAKQVLDFFRKREKPPVEDKVNLTEVYFRPKKDEKKELVNSLRRSRHNMKSDSDESNEHDEHHQNQKQALLHMQAKAKLAKARLQSTADSEKELSLKSRRGKHSERRFGASD